nr:thermonuclease family protein [Lichenihabitans psoromatis]
MTEAQQTEMPRRWPETWRLAAGLLIGSLLVAWPAAGQSAAPAWAPVAASAAYQTGDSWTDHGLTYRLYGVQSCLRGTTFTNAHGQVRDCGETSLAMLVALIRDLHPQCIDAGKTPRSSTVLVFCIAQPTAGAGAGSRIDLGTALIATGFAFAALGPDGQPIHPPYLVAELVAQRTHAGLWAFADLPDPNAIILRALGKQRAAGSGVPSPATPSTPTP